MAKLNIISKVEIHNDDIRHLLPKDTVEISPILFLSATLIKNGDLVCLAGISGFGEPDDEKPLGAPFYISRFLFSTDGGTVKLSEINKEWKYGRLGQNVYAILDDGFIFFGKDESATLITVNSDDDLTHDTHPVKVINPIPEHKFSENVTYHYQPKGGNFIGTNVSAFCIHNGSTNEYVAFAKFDRESMTLTWQVWPEVKLAKSGLLSKLFGSKEQSPAPTTDTMIKLHPDDYPIADWSKQYGSHVHDAVWLDGAAYIFTKGPRDSPKYGYDGATIAKIDRTGRVSSTILQENFLNTPDLKKYGREGFFTNHGKLFVMSSTYQTTDPYKGLEMLVDIPSGEMEPLELPRGYKGFKVITIQNNIVWMQRLNDKKEERFLELIKAELV